MIFIPVRLIPWLAVAAGTYGGLSHLVSEDAASGLGVVAGVVAWASYWVLRERHQLGDWQWKF